MSRENVRIVRQTLDAFQRGDLESMLSVVHAEFELRTDDAAILAAEQSVWRGREGLLEFLERLLEPWEEFRIEANEFVDAGDRVVVLLDQFGRPAGSDFEVQMSVGHIYTVRERQIAAWESYTDQGRALKAVGLRE
jgi:ketosteroid isomerase-like protein